MKTWKERVKEGTKVKGHDDTIYELQPQKRITQYSGLSRMAKALLTLLK